MHIVFTGRSLRLLGAALALITLTLIDAMIPHHRMAVAAAKLELASGSHPELKALALSIIESQSREIGLMQAYREVWYGSIDHMPGMGH